MNYEKWEKKNDAVYYKDDVLVDDSDFEPLFFFPNKIHVGVIICIIFF